MVSPPPSPCKRSPAVVVKEMTNIRRDAILPKPVRRRSIEDHEVLARFSHSLTVRDDNKCSDNPTKGQDVAAFIAAALETIEFYEAEISSLIDTTAS